MKPHSKKILLPGTALLFIFLCGAFVFIYRATYGNAQKAEANAALWQSERDKRESARTLDRTLAELVPERAALDSHFAKSTDIVPFLDTIEKLAPKAGAEAEVNSVDTVTQGGLTVGLTARGTFPAVYTFLTLLENSPYELSFLSMDMHKVGVSNTGTQSGAWEAVFKIKLLSFMQQ